MTRQTRSTRNVSCNVNGPRSPARGCKYTRWREIRERRARARQINANAVAQTYHNYHYQSKICGNPSPRLNYLDLPARTRSGVDHRFSWKHEGNERLSTRIRRLSAEANYRDTREIPLFLSILLFFYDQFAFLSISKLLENYSWYSRSGKSTRNCSTRIER